MAQSVDPTEGFLAWLNGQRRELNLWLHLYVNDPALVAGLTVADFIEPTFTGYSVQAATGWTPPILRDGKARMWADPVTWLWDGTVASQAIRGYFATHGAAGPLARVWRPDGDPVVLSEGNPSLTVFIQLTYPAG